MAGAVALVPHHTRVGAQRVDTQGDTVGEVPQRGWVGRQAACVHERVFAQTPQGHDRLPPVWK